MSTSPYSLDLRKKVINFIKSGNSQRSCAKIFALNLSTVSRWWIKYREEGHCRPKKRTYINLRNYNKLLRHSSMCANLTEITILCSV